jgi:hypothetical protein
MDREGKSAKEIREAIKRGEFKSIDVTDTPQEDDNDAK